MCCKKQEAIDSEEEKSILEKTIEEMVEENDIQNKYIAKIRAERKEFAVDAIKNEEELKEIINTRDLEILKAKDKIDDLETQLMRHINKNTTDAETQTDNFPKKSISVQTSPVMNEKKRKLITKIDKKSNPHKKGMQMILRNNTQKQRNQLEETALQVYGEATDEQESVSIGSLSSDLEEHSFVVSNSEKTPEDINKKSLLEELETAQSILVHKESAVRMNKRLVNQLLEKSLFDFLQPASPSGRPHGLPALPHL
ncbi:hypothetical protein JTB14_008888 [Gonioctena quinquepunctata]|nr:hypothetical protein JTB14_008888 [Gonioctena quinquepunctata]